MVACSVFSCAILSSTRFSVAVSILALRSSSRWRWSKASRRLDRLVRTSISAGVTPVPERSAGSVSGAAGFSTWPTRDLPAWLGSALLIAAKGSGPALGSVVAAEAGGLAGVAGFAAETASAGATASVVSAVSGRDVAAMGVVGCAGSFAGAAERCAGAVARGAFAGGFAAGAVVAGGVVGSAALAPKASPPAFSANRIAPTPITAGRMRTSALRDAWRFLALLIAFLSPHGAQTFGRRRLRWTQHTWLAGAFHA